MTRPRTPRPRFARAALTALVLLVVCAPLAPAQAAHLSAAPGRPSAGQVDAVGIWPLSPQPAVVDDFSPPVSRWGPGHRGVDLAGVVGQRVRAALAGTVTFAGRLAGRGVVVVSHGETRTTYEPVRASVGVGDRVRGGGTIGRLELAGSHCLPASCLHWGLLRGEDYLDPLTLVGAGPVRLLPWLSRSATGFEGWVPAAPSVPGTSEGGHVPPQLPGWRPLGDSAPFRG